MSKKLNEIFVQEFVLGLGFFGGFWVHVGINPESEVLKALSTIVKTLVPNSNFSLLFWMIPVVDMMFSILFAYVLGGWLGLIAIFLAFLGGVFIESMFGIVLLIIAVFLGIIAPSVKEEARIL